MIALIAAAATFSVAPVFAETLSFNADLKGSSEVPPVNTQANGTLSATYDMTQQPRTGEPGSAAAACGTQPLLTKRP